MNTLLFAANATATNTAVNIFKSFGFSFIHKAIAITNLYMIAPNIDKVVAFINDIFPKMDTPIITAANPITTIPVPIVISENPWFCAVNAPDNATNALLMDNPKTLTIFLFTPNDDTTCSLSPTATNKNPVFVFKNKSNTTFTKITIAKIINIELIAGFLKIWLVLNNGIFDIIIKDDKFFEENDDVILINEDNYMISIDEENEDNIIISGRGEYNGTKW